MTLKAITKVFQYGEQTIKLETGVVARQATAAVMASMGDTTVLATVVCADKVPEGIDFFPLTVHYQERTYAAGRIPGGYFKREGRPTEKETLTSRLIDRPLRPLFPEGFYNEVQIIVTVLSLDPQIDADIIAMIAASAALAVSGIPFQGPIGAARVGYTNNNFVLNPTAKQISQSDLDLVVAGTDTAVLMVESEARELPEEIMLGAVVYGHEQMQTVVQAIKEFAQEAGKPPRDWQPAASNQTLIEQVENLVRGNLTDAYQVREKQERRAKIDALRDQVVQQLKNEEAGINEKTLLNIFSSLEEKIVRGRILAGMPRIDGRDTKTVRPITINTGILPRTHGSVLFTRGETQALVVTTLGTDRDAQIVDYLEGEVRESFMLHYNFPPFSVGEIGQVGSPKRREIGHGRLAKRAIQAVLPTEEAFPYVLRVVSEITESNGSSSMATVCGTSLALRDAGVPLKASVAGIAMGLIKEGNRYAILTDILGDEDHLGDMDFKVAGTTTGVTALQMDIKINGITKEIMDSALQQAKEARLHILNIMDEALPAQRETISDYAPRVVTIRINPEKIRDVIGKGGATIRAITEETGTLIDINDNGVIRIATPDKNACQAALDRIKKVTADVEVGGIYEGTVVKLTDFGAFVTILPGRDGLLHISQIANERIERVSDRLQEGQTVRVKVLEVDKQGRIRLTMKDLTTAPTAPETTTAE